MEMPSAERVWLAADLANLPDDGNRYEVIDGELHVTPAPRWIIKRPSPVCGAFLRCTSRRNDADMRSSRRPT